MSHPLFRSLAKLALRHPPMKFHMLLYRIGLGPVIGKLILLLITTGRTTGLPRVTPLQYEEIDGAIYLGSSRGAESDWFKNAKAHPRVHMRVGSREFEGIAEPVTDPSRIADFIQYRLQRHPRMMGAMLAADGLPRNPNRDELERYVSKLAMLVVRPL